MMTQDEILNAWHAALDEQREEMEAIEAVTKQYYYIKLLERQLEAEKQKLNELKKEL